MFVCVPLRLSCSLNTFARPLSNMHIGVTLTGRAVYPKKGGMDGGTGGVGDG